MAALYLHDDYEEIDNEGWVETHQYTYTGGSTPVQDMITTGGIGNPNTRYKDCSSNLWPITSGLTGLLLSQV